MDKVKELIKQLRDIKEKSAITENSSQADILIYKIHKKKTTNKEYLDLDKEISDYLKSDAPYENKLRVAGDGECVYMICSAINDYSLNVDELCSKGDVKDVRRYEDNIIL